MVRPYAARLGETERIAFGGLRVDDLIEAMLLDVVQSAATQAGLATEGQSNTRHGETQAVMAGDLKAPRHAADRAFWQYNAAVYDNRFVTGELEAR